MLAMLCAFVSAPAQVRELNRTEAGNGTLRIARTAEERIREVRFKISPDGRFELTLTATRSDILFGTWRALSSREYLLTIDRGFGRDGATGTGRVMLGDGNRIDNVAVNGKTRNLVFTVEFAGRATPPANFPGDGKFSELSISRKSNGTLNEAGRIKGFDTVEIKLFRDGTFELAFRGQAKFRVHGTWKWGRSDVELNVLDALGDHRARGNGTLFIKRQGNDPWKLDIRGSAKGSDFSVSAGF
jgi:hypothetical protein